MYFYFKHIPPMNNEEIISYVKVNSENSFTWFPADEQNPDYQQYLSWITEGNEPEEWNPDTNTDTIEEDI